MTQYKRITGKVFGGNATATGNDPQIAQFGSALAGTFVGTTDPETIQSLPAWGQGWIGAVTPETQFPPMPEMTGAMKVLSHQICGILQQGISTWDNGTIYYIGNFCSKNGNLYVSLSDENQGNDPETDTTNWQEFSSGGSGFNLFDTKLSDHILTYEETKGWALQGTYVYKTAIAGERYGYPTFIETCINEKNAGTATQVTLGSNTLTMYVNDNGHQYYDITDKSKVDAFFNTFGIADFYGVDETNERIFLPRNNYFNQLTTSTANVNKFTQSGLPSHTHTRGTMDITGTVATQGDFGVVNSGGSVTGAFYGGTAKSNGIEGKAGVQSWDLGFQASRNWTGSTSTPNYSSTVNNSSVVQPPSSSKLLYYCVGNTTTDNSWVDVVTQVEEGVKDLEDKTNEGIEALANASNALRQTQITNCLLELPQNIKFDLADGILTLKAGSIVTIPNGFEEDGVTPKFDYVTIESDNQLDLKNIPARSFLFWAPSTQKFNYRPMETVYSGSSDPATSATTYYQINNNIVVSHNLSGDINVTLPILIFNSDGVNVSIDQVFNGIGYIGSTIWVDKEIKGLIPNGRNEDGTLNNIEFVTNAVHTQTFTASNTYADNSYWITNSGEFGGSNANIKYHSDINKVLYNVDNTSRLYCNIGKYTVENGKITSFQVKQPFQALDYNDKPEITSWGMPSDKYIDLTIGATGATYVAPANGFINVIINSANGYLYVNCFDSNNTYCYSSTESNGTSTTGSRVLCPIRKGHKYQIGYSGTVSQFRFIYAQGEV